mmetsp:Transcript_7411/g.16087  ORF Transcript_7411/g.16087 Transcript_7411/m.16087 type:complete len:283 (-) Transcript_7411:67-915(-)
MAWWLLRVWGWCRRVCTLHGRIARVLQLQCRRAVAVQVGVAPGKKTGGAVGVAGLTVPSRHGGRSGSTGSRAGKRHRILWRLWAVQRLRLKLWLWWRGWRWRWGGCAAHPFCLYEVLNALEEVVVIVHSPVVKVVLVNVLGGTQRVLQPPPHCKAACKGLDARGGQGQAPLLLLPAHPGLGLPAQPQLPACSQQVRVMSHAVPPPCSLDDECTVGQALLVLVRLQHGHVLPRTTPSPHRLDAGHVCSRLLYQALVVGRSHHQLLRPLLLLLLRTLLPLRCCM